MLKDPLTKWNGHFPYDALAAVGITPASSMAEILDASFELMMQGLMSAAVRQAWDELRSTERRLFVDFFLYQLDLSAEMARAAEVFEDTRTDWGETFDPSSLSTPDPSLLQQIGEDFHEIPTEPIEIDFISDFDQEQRPSDSDLISFDY